jgi:hypothetical protein
MSVSVKPRLAGRQPSNRGGVPRVMTWLTAEVAEASAGPRLGPKYRGACRDHVYVSMIELTHPS